MDERQLMSVGFTREESKIYIALVELGGATIAEVASMSRLSIPVVLEIIEDLCDRSIVACGDRRVYSPVNTAAIESLIREKVFSAGVFDKENS